MKKRIISLILTLVTALSFVSFSACDDKEAAPKLATAVNEQYLDKIVDIYELQNGFATPEEKTEFVTMVENTVKQNSGLINAVGDKVVYPSGMTDKKIMNFLNAYDEYLKSLAEVGEYVNGLIVKYENDITASLIEGADTSVLYDAQSVTEFIQALSTIIEKENFSALLDKIAANEKAGAVAVMKNVNSKAKNFYNSIYVEDMCAVFINFAYEFNNIGIDTFLGIPDSLWSEVIAEFEVMKGKLDAIGLGEANKKEAYLKLISFVFGEMKEQAVICCEVDASVAFDLAISVAKLSVAEEGVAQINALGVVTTNVSAILKDLGTVVSSHSDKKIKEMNGIIEACKTLDKNSLGYYAERFAPLYFYSQSFVGALCTVVEGKDLVWLYASVDNGTFSKHLTDYTSEEILEGEEGFYKVAELLSHYFESALAKMKNEEQFISAINKAVGDGGITMNLLLKSTDDLNGFYEIDYAKNANFAKLSTENQNEIKRAYSDLILCLSSISVVKGDVENAKDSLMTFLQPMVDAYEYFSGFFGTFGGTY